MSDVNVFDDRGRLKAVCKFSSSGDTWIGFCKFCKNDCALAGKTQDEIKAMAGM
jgi:hypothetical protein